MSADHIFLVGRILLGGMFVVVLASDRERTMSVRGLPAGRYVASYTTATETGRELSLVSNGTIAVTLPAEGIMTIRQEGQVRPGSR